MNLTSTSDATSRATGVGAVLLCAGACLLAAAVSAAPALPGGFEGESEVGTVAHKGTVRFDAGSGAYTMTGGGAAMGEGRDAFHFVWRHAAGDLSLSASVAFPEK